MTSSPDLAALLVRVEAAEGADREIDKAINLAIGRDNRFHQDAGYTRSLDSALALCGRILPGRYWRAAELTPGEVSGMRPPGNQEFWATVGPAGAQEQAFGFTPALALIAAMLRALLALAGDTSGGGGEKSNGSAVAGLPSSQEGSDTQDIRQAGKED